MGCRIKLEREQCSQELAAGASEHRRNSWVVDTGQPYLAIIDEALSLLSISIYLTDIMLFYERLMTDEIVWLQTAKLLILPFWRP